jgi:hypothetical protein
MEKNNITAITRRNIADQITVGKFLYPGRLDEPDFLGRLYDLDSLPSTDDRYSNARDDIWKHTVMNNDWPADWVFGDRRFNLMQGPDEPFLAFLSETIHPAVRSNAADVQELLSIYNKALAADDYELIQVDDISGLPVFRGHRRLDGTGALREQGIAIKRYLDTIYIQGRLKLIQAAIHSQTDLAIGLAKELLETTCHSILLQQGKPIDKDWTVIRLLKETTSSRDFTPRGLPDAGKASTSVRQMLTGLASTVQAITELRNAFGSGHGKAADFKGLEPKYAKFVVSIVGEICLLLLGTNQEAVELVEAEQPLPIPVAPAGEATLDDLPF